MPTAPLRAWGLLTLAVVALVPRPGTAAPINITRPGHHEFVRDLAGLINPTDLHQIREVCLKLLHDKEIPVIVVTIESMAKYGCPDMPIETFARLLFDEWGIGQATVHGHPWNKGVLLLVSKGDRQARIQLGAGWAKDKDATCHRILEEQIIPFFKHGDFSGGILSGVESLNRLSRGQELPEQPAPWWAWVALGLIFAVIFYSLFDVIQNGTRGWSWVCWSVVLGILGMLLASLLTNRGSRGGSYSDDSFGGGFSDGGGASDSW